MKPGKPGVNLSDESKYQPGKPGGHKAIGEKPPFKNTTPAMGGSYHSKSMNRVSTSEADTCVYVSKPIAQAKPGYGKK